MISLVNIPWSIVFVVMGFGQVFDMTALRETIQSVADYFLNHCFWLHAIFSNFDDDCKD